MGNSHNDPAVRDGAGGVHEFFTSGDWIDGRALDQLQHLSRLEGVSAVAGFPDLHPGKYGPVGCAVLADRLYPQLVGSDIGCGMGLFRLDLPQRKLKIDKAAARMRGLSESGDATEMAARLEQVGLPDDLAPEALGSVGGGNHFCEVQKVVRADAGCELAQGDLVLLVHSGSRGVGHGILARLLADGIAVLDPDNAEGRAYLAQHDKAVAWARLNRQIIAERAARALRTQVSLMIDAPHNLLSDELGGWLHRKGAVVARGLVPLAGSRASPSYLMQSLEAEGALASSAHGAGRKFDRNQMHGRVRAGRGDLAGLTRTPLGGRVICEDKALLIEEAPLAYKAVEQVAAALERTGVARVVAEMHPVITFKRARAGAAP